MMFHANRGSLQQQNHEYGIYNSNDKTNIMTCSLTNVYGRVIHYMFIVQNIY